LKSGVLPVVAIVSNWMHVDFFTVDQAAALWCGLEPSVMKPLDAGTPSEALAIKQMLTGAILSQQLPADSTRRTALP
jgi:hypothetical protein